MPTALPRTPATLNSLRRGMVVTDLPIPTRPCCCLRRDLFLRRNTSANPNPLGFLPFQSKDGRKQRLDEFLRRLREEDPPRPSTKVGTEKESSQAVSQARGAEPRQLVSLLHGDLDWITMKALEKDRARRYSSPMELAADIGRYLRDEPVTARPASARYRVEKYVRRHKALVAGTAAVFVVLVAGVIASTWQAVKARRAEAQAKQQSAIARAVNDFLRNDLLSQASAATQSGPSAKPDPDLKVRTALDRAADRIEGKFVNQPEVEAGIWDTIGQTYTDLGLHPAAEKQLQRALDLRRRVLGPEDVETLGTMNNLAAVYDLEGKYAQAETLFNQTLGIQRRVLGLEHRFTLNTMSSLAADYQRQGRYALAESYGAQTLAGRRRAQGPEHPDTMIAASDLALAYVSQGKFTESEPLAREAMLVDRKKQPDDWQGFGAESLLGASIAGEKKYAAAEPLLLEGYQGMLARKNLIAASDRYHLEIAHQWLVQLYKNWGKPEKIAAIAKESD
jgi:eukaryotic-like serine/threonine-protein kinase